MFPVFIGFHGRATAKSLPARSQLRTFLGRVWLRLEAAGPPSWMPHAGKGERRDLLRNSKSKSKTGLKRAVTQAKRRQLLEELQEPHWSLSGENKGGGSQRMNCRSSTHLFMLSLSCQVCLKWEWNIVAVARKLVSKLRIIVSQLNNSPSLLTPSGWIWPVADAHVTWWSHPINLTA